MKLEILNKYIWLTCFVIIFSLLFLSLLTNYTFKSEHSVAMLKYSNSYDQKFDYKLKEFLNTKKFKNYEFTGNEILDKEILKQYRVNVNTLIKSKDTLKGIRFKFNNVTNYQNFINVFDVCFIENAEYIYNEKDLWIVSPLAINSHNKHLFYINMIDN